MDAGLELPVGKLKNCLIPVLFASLTASGLLSFCILCSSSRILSHGLEKERSTHHLGPSLSCPC